MRIWIGSDHRGVKHKALIKNILIQEGHEVEDVGTSQRGPCDYPDCALPVAKAVSDGRADRGILICASGIGMSMTANRLKGVRATLCFNEQMAVTARRHNDSNILCLGQDITDEDEVKGILEKWLVTEFEGGRHARRLKKLDDAG